MSMAAEGSPAPKGEAVNSVPSAACPPRLAVSRWSIAGSSCVARRALVWPRRLRDVCLLLVVRSSSSSSSSSLNFRPLTSTVTLTKTSIRGGFSFLKVNFGLNEAQRKQRRDDESDRTEKRRRGGREEMAGRHSALLLLTDTPLAFAALKETCGHALSTILQAHATASRDDKDRGPAVLDIAVSACGKGKPFDLLQRFLADMYRLLAAVSAAASVELDGPGGVDARVFFVDLDGQACGDACSYGPIIGVKSLMRSNRSWDTVYLASGCERAASFAAMLSARETTDNRIKTADVRTLDLKTSGEKPSTGLVLGQGTAPPTAAAHSSVAVGGTFDHLHAGHKLLLTATVLALDTCSSISQPAQRDGQEKRVVTVGITGDELLVNKKYAEFLESWEDRWQGVWRFLQSIIDFSSSSTVDIRRENEPGPNGRRVVVSLSPGLEFRFVQIADPFGPTITDRDITALVVSKETRSGGQAVNDERLKKGWPTLEVFEVDVLDTADAVSASEDSFESKISSTEIRRRRMNLAKESSL